MDIWIGVLSFIDGIEKDWAHFYGTVKITAQLGNISITAWP
jgi:hypothetical protein